jgi:cytochrome c oxidase subunit 3
MQNITNTTQRKKIHPHKFAMWVGMGSIAMMFAGLTSAYMVREAQGFWRVYDLPWVFFVSTAVILISSGTMHYSVKTFKAREIPKFRRLITVTLILGVVFCALQMTGFYQLYHTKQLMNINGKITQEATTVRLNGNPSESFLFIIAGLHMLHILGGIIALIIVFFRAFRTNVKVYQSTGLEIVASYWHFVDILWIYLFIFFDVNH